MRYVPILKAKEGEFGALSDLDLHVRSLVTPLLEIPGIPYDYVNDRPARTLDAHVGGIAEKIKANWGDGRPVYIDFSAHSAEQHLADGRHALDLILAEAQAVNVHTIPVVYPSDSDSALAAVARFAAPTGMGACIRLTVDDFNEEIDVEDRVGGLLDRLNLSASETDLILDLKEIGSELSRAVLLVRAIIAGTPEVSSWRRVILAGSSFPEDLRDVDASTTRTLPRSEWELWQALHRRVERLPRRDIVYADYGITHPALKDIDPRLMTMSASIRYTGRDEWVLIKGRNVRQHGFDQYFALCESLVKHPAYSGREFSWGDGYIATTAEGTTGPGNATTWRKVGTNHHITLAAIQLANLNGS